LPIEYKSVEDAIVDFEIELLTVKNDNSRSNINKDFNFAGHEFSYYSFSESVNSDYELPEFLTIDEWFFYYCRQ
jgi:hypothetical protein